MPIKKGSVDHLLVVVAIGLLLVIPLFQFFIAVFATLHRIEQTKEILEIASLTTYTMLNQESLGIGDLDIPESSATEIFHRQVETLIAEKLPSDKVGETGIRFRKDGNKIDIESDMILFSEFDEPIRVRKSLEFVMDPVTEDSQ